MAELVNSRVLDESKIEDDDMVDIVFKLTNFADETSTPVRKTQKMNQSNLQSSVRTPESSTGQKRQLSLDQNDPSNQSEFVRTRETSNQVYQQSNHNTTSQIQKTVQISTTKTVTLSKESYSNVQNDSGQSHRPPRKKKTRSKSDLGLFNFKMFKQQGSQVTSDVRQSGDGTDRPDPPVSQVEGKVETVNPRKCFVHYDSQSVLADFSDASICTTSNNFANLKSGAATANIEDCIESDPDSLLLQTPNFINELYEEPKVKSCGAGSSTYYKNCPKYQVVMFEGPPANRQFNGPSNRDKLLAGINLSDFTIDRRFLNFEHMDHGANYYRRFFADHDHVNYFGISEPHGPLAISMQREKTDSAAERGEANYQYRIIIRSVQSPTLRGSILEDFLPCSRGSNKVHFRDILECLTPQIKQENLKLAENKVAVVDELLKFDEITMNVTYKIGLVYCKAGQKTEEEMYNNDAGSPAFDEFLETIGEKVALKGFDSFRGGLDNKSDTTGTHSVYTRYNNCQIMFHVATLLPYTENDRQQVVRKRHIGNDIVTVIFQEPGSSPFTPAHFRSHYQHVFIVVRVSNPNTPETTYQIAVTRSDEVPEFGPAIPEETMKKGAAFRHFLLTKVINAENASLKAKKLALMAKRTREQLLKNFCETLCTSTTLVPNPKKSGNPGKLGRSWSFKRKARFAQRLAPELVSRGALKWSVSVVEEGVEKPCMMAISPTQIVIKELKTKTMMYMLPCKAVLGWTSTMDSLKLYYDTGEVIVMKRDTTSTQDDSTSDIDDIVKRLTCTSDGCETQEIRVIKNQQGKLGFHIQFQGIVGDVTENGPAWAAGLRCSSRLVEVRGTLVAHLEHEQLITHLKGKDTIVVVALPPFPDGQPRRSISQLQSPTDVRPKASSVSTTRPSVGSPTPAPTPTAPSLAGSESNDVIAPLVDRRMTTPESSSRPESRESINARAMTRGSMIALNLLEQELGIDDTEHIDLDEFLESIVGKDKLKELDDEVKELEARSTSSSRPNTPSYHNSQQSLNSEDGPFSPGATRHKSFVVSPTSPKRRELTPASESKENNDIGMRFALGSDNLDTGRNNSTVGKRFALRTDTLDFGSTRSNRSVIGAERQNGHPRSGSRDSTHEKPDINEIFKIIDKTRLESEANNRSPTDDISEIDAVVSMIEKVLENTDSYLNEELSTRGLPSDSDNDNNTVSDAAGPRSTAAPASSSPYSSTRSSRARADENTPRNGTSGRQSPNRTITASPYCKPNNQKVENIQRKMGDYTDDIENAIEQLDSINLQDTARRKPSISSSSLSDEAPPQYSRSRASTSPLHQTDQLDQLDQQDRVGRPRDTCDKCTKMQRPGLIVTRPSRHDVLETEDDDVSKKSNVESDSLEDSSPDSMELVGNLSGRLVVGGARKSKSLGDMLSLTRGSPQVTSDSVNINTESEQSTSDDEFPQRHFTMRRMRREGLLMEQPSESSDQSRASDDIPPSPLQMLMERAREAQLDQTAENDNSWVRTTLLRIAELEAALERSNFELQALRKQNREMEQTLEIVDEENAKIRREMDRTNSQLATFTTWVQSRQLL
ncbi:signal-induced proliferation-associated 1-like protein 1 isoform X3 [Bolinopsis microptera]|uniref:signal-induced proliferation-associated 1-like protein 1 isoform X3 n=1 Tax=Bolinopsis microptera TaxID=2820187 RepID=UPI00307AE1A3